MQLEDGYWRRIEVVESTQLPEILTSNVDYHSIAIN
jgi:hypothetical protein